MPASRAASGRSRWRRRPGPPARCRSPQANASEDRDARSRRPATGPPSCPARTTGSRRAGRGRTRPRGPAQRLAQDDHRRQRHHDRRQPQPGDEHAVDRPQRRPGQRASPSATTGIGSPALRQQPGDDAADARTASRSRCRSAGRGSRASCPTAATSTGALLDQRSRRSCAGPKNRGAADRQDDAASRPRRPAATDSSRRYRPIIARPPPLPRRVPERQLQDRLLRRLGPVERADDRCRRASPRSGRSCRGPRAAPTRSSGSPGPAPASSPISRWISAFAPTSTPCVGSSRISTAGSVASQRASATFCWLPPDRLPTGRVDRRRLDRRAARTNVRGQLAARGAKSSSPRGEIRAQDRRASCWPRPACRG